MHQYLPSKKFSYILGTIVLVAILIWGAKALSDRQNRLNILSTAEKTAAENQKNTLLEQFMTVDSDQDGLKDWEESLWKTDPKKSDTDGDGTNDGDEIKVNRDPTKPNTAGQGEPNDKIDVKIIEANKKADEDFSKLSTTDKFGRTLFSDYLASKKNNSQLTSSDMSNIVSGALSNLSPLTFKVYTNADLTLSAKSDNKTLSDYSNTLAEIILTNLQTKTETIDSILTDFSNSNNTAEAADTLTRIAPITVKDQVTISALLKVSVPTVLVNEHLKILNALEEVYESALMMSEAKADMILMVQPLNHYNASIQSLSDSLLSIRQKLFDLKVTFTNKNDFGYELFNVIMLKN